MEMKRILYHHRTRARDGQAVHVRFLINAFRALGHQVKEVSLVRHGDEGSGPGKGGKLFFLALLLPRFTLEILEHLYGSVGTRKILAAAKGFDPHFIYERYALSNLAGIHAKEKLGLPLFLEVNSPMVLEMERLGKLAFRRWARRVEYQIFQRSDLIFAVSGVLKKMLVDQGVAAGKILVQHNGVDPSLFPPEEEKEAIRKELGLAGRRVIGFSGFLRDWHRMDMALESMASLVRSGFEDLQLLIVGGGPGCRPLREQAASLGVGDRVRITGEMPPEEVPRWVSTFHVGVLPAINPYASPLKLFDYLAAGVPTVAPDQENLREVVEHGKTALLFEKGNPLAFEESVKSLLEDPELADRIGRNGRASIEERGFTWKENARRVIQAYEERYGNRRS